MTTMQGIADRALGDAPPDDGPAPAAPLRFRPASALIADPRPVAIVDGLVWADSTEVVVSESGAGKTFLLLGLAAAVANGRDFHGRATVRGSAAYVSYEGDALGLRLQALEEAGYPLDDVHILRASEPISPRVGREGIEMISMGEAAVREALDVLARELALAGRPPIVLLVVDTIRASMAGSEDSSEHTSAYLRAVGRIKAGLPGAAVVLAHHAGWQDQAETKRKRERGSSALRGNVDATLYLEVIEDDPENHRAFLELRTLKARDAEKLPPLRLVRRRVDVHGVDRDGQPLTSCVIESDGRSRAERDAEAQRETAAADHEADLKVLAAMRDYPAATSQQKLRRHVGLRLDVVGDAVARILRAGWALEGKRGHPFLVTDAGQQVLGGSR